MNTKEEAGRRIRALRLGLDMRLEDVNKQVPEISVSRLSNWEQGLNMIGVDEAKKLAPILGTTAAYILTIDDALNDQREQALIDNFRHSDERGKTNISRLAESESTSTVDMTSNTEQRDPTNNRNGTEK